MIRVIYLSTSFTRRDEMREIRDILVDKGHIVTSRWIDRDIWPGGISIQPFYPVFAYGSSMEDIIDIDKSELIIQDVTDLSGSKGGTHIELGIAIALDKEIWLIGEPFNVFHYHHNIKHFDNWQIVMNKLKRYK